MEKGLAEEAGQRRPLYPRTIDRDTESVRNSEVKYDGPVSAELTGDDATCSRTHSGTEARPCPLPLWATRGSPCPPPLSAAPTDHTRTSLPTAHCPPRCGRHQDAQGQSATPGRGEGASTLLQTTVRRQSLARAPAVHPTFLLTEQGACVWPSAVSKTGISRPANR